MQHKWGWQLKYHTERALITWTSIRMAHSAHCCAYISVKVDIRRFVFDDEHLLFEDVCHDTAPHTRSGSLHKFLLHAYFLLAILFKRFWHTHSIMRKQHNWLREVIFLFASCDDIEKHRDTESRVRNGESCTANGQLRLWDSIQQQHRIVSETAPALASVAANWVAVMIISHNEPIILCISYF